MQVGPIVFGNPKAWGYVGAITAGGMLVAGPIGAAVLGIPALAIGGFLTGWGNPMFQRSLDSYKKK